MDNLGPVVIDYLQLMIWNQGGENRWQLAIETSRMLKIIVDELNVPVLCLSQLSRVTEELENRRPILSDLRESGSFVSEADIVLLLYRDSYYNEDLKKHNIVEYIVAKNLHGETGTVELRWMPEDT